MRTWRAWLWCLCVLGLWQVSAVQAQSLPRRVTDLTQGFRFEPPLTQVALAPSDPKVAYLGSGPGFIFVTRDGGQSWDEVQVRVSRGSFVGSIRATGEPDLYPTYNPYGISGFFRPSRVLNLSSPLESVSEAFLNADRVETRAVEGAYDDLHEGSEPLLGGGGGGGGSALGVGLRAGSPWLTLALRRTKGWAIGLNIKQTLSLFASPPTEVFWLSVAPDDPDDVFAGTQDGLLHSTNGGDSWATVLTSAGTWGRYVNHVLRNPHKPQQVFASTGEGLMISEDGGQTFLRASNPLLSTSWVNSFAIHPKNPQFMAAGLDFGLVLSRDGGQSWDFVFRSPWPPQSDVLFVVFEPDNEDRFYFSTGDGMFYTQDGGKNFERLGGLLFVGEAMRAVTHMGRAGHLVVATQTELWESTDGGENWSVVYYGRTQWDNRYVVASPHEAGTLWVVTWAEILKLSPGSLREVPPDLLARWKRLTGTEPGASLTVETAVRRAGVYRGDLTEQRRSSRLKALLPRLRTSWVYAQQSGQNDAVSRLLGGVPTASGQLEPQLRNQSPASAWGVFAHMSWSLGGTVFSLSEAPIDRVDGVSRDAEWKIRSTTLALYLERRRLQLQMITEPTQDARQQLMRDLRMEELTAHLNVLTGDLFTPYQALPGR